MTTERANYIIENTRKYGEFKYAFKAHFRQGSPTFPDGITEQEDKDIKALWKTMSGYSCYRDAVLRIAKGNEKGS